MGIKTLLKEAWHFIWEDDSLASWIVNVVIAFVIVKFIVYPGLGLLLGTHYPIVAVVSGSMEHHGVPFDEWWVENKEWYEERGITKHLIESAVFPNGFSKGDIIILVGAKPDRINIGDVIVYSTDKHKYPIIHRITKKENQNETYIFETKGDNNRDRDPLEVTEGQLLGRAVFKLPYLGWVKIIFTQIIGGM